MQRVCFLMHLKPERIGDYLRAHEVVWPEMLDALRAAGWTNYSLHLQKDTGLVVGYVETPDYKLATSQMARQEVNARWQTTMSEFFEEGRPDEGVEVLTEYFHLP